MLGLYAQVKNFSTMLMAMLSLINAVYFGNVGSVTSTDLLK